MYLIIIYFIYKITLSLFSNLLIHIMFDNVFATIQIVAVGSDLLTIFNWTLYFQPDSYITMFSCYKNLMVEWGFNAVLCIPGIDTYMTFDNRY